MVDMDTLEVLASLGGSILFAGIPTYLFERAEYLAEKRRREEKENIKTHTQEQIDDIRPFFRADPVGCYRWAVEIMKDTYNRTPYYVAVCATDALDELKPGVMEKVNTELKGKFQESIGYLGNTPLEHVSDIYMDTIHQRAKLRLFRDRGG